jgi:hypothetical protein
VGPTGGRYLEVPEREGLGVLLVTVLLVTLGLVVASVVFLVAGSAQGAFVLVSLSVAGAAVAGIVGVLSAPRRHARAARLVAQAGRDDLLARAAATQDHPLAAECIPGRASAQEEGSHPSGGDDPNAPPGGPLSGPRDE